MNFIHIEKKDLKTAHWSGGATTQLYIYPRHSDYKAQDFDFRLSTATVDTPESDFTHLPSYQRNLMILNGTIYIKHSEHYQKTMKPFDIDCFEGKWKTKGYGKCIDFNLMTRPPYSGTLTRIELRNKQYIDINPKLFCLALYCINDASEFHINNEHFRMKKGDVLILNTENQPLRLNSHNDIDLIQAEILKST